MTKINLKYLILFCLLFSLNKFSIASHETDSLLNKLLHCHDTAKCTIYSDLANIFLDSVGDKSQNFSKLAIKYAEKNKNYNNLAYAYIMSGSAYLLKSDYANSITQFNKALEISKSSKNYYQIHTIYNNLGVVYKNSNDYELALKYYTLALDYAYQSIDIQSIVQSLSNIGNLYILQEKYQRGLEYYYRAIDESRNSEILLSDIPAIYNNIAYVHFSLKDYEKALLGYNSALEYFKDFDNIFGQAIIHNNIAEVYIEQRKFNLAEAHINISDSLHKLMDYKTSRKNLYYTAYQLFSSSKNYEIAIEYLEKHHALKDSIYNIELDEKISDIRTKYEVDKINEESKLKDLELSKQKQIRQFMVLLTLFLGIIIILLVKMIRHKVQINSKLKYFNETISAKQTEISDNLDYARNIQLSCMDNPVSFYSLDYAVLDLPKSVVGGDFYLVREIDNEQIFALADSTGHGISGGFLSVLGIEFLTEALEKNSKLSLVLNYLNNRFFRYITSSDKLRSESLCLSLIKLTGLVLTYSGSKQKIWIYSTKQDRIIEYKTNAEIIGLSDEISFSEHTLELNIGDIIFLSSDGYADQFGGRENSKLKYPRFREILHNAAVGNFEDILEYLKRELADWQGDKEQTDDILVLAIKIK